MLNHRFGLRCFYYFRQGYAVYLTALIGGSNVLTTTYFLMIDRVPTLGGVFTSFELYILTVLAITLPIITMIGWIHFKRTGTYAADVRAIIRDEPYNYRYKPGFEVLYGDVYLTLYRLNLKIQKNEKLTDEELEHVKTLEKKLDDLIKGGYEGNPPPGVI